MCVSFGIDCIYASILTFSAWLTIGTQHDIHVEYLSHLFLENTFEVFIIYCYFLQTVEEENEASSNNTSGATTKIGRYK